MEYIAPIISIIAIIVSVISIFISNWLGIQNQNKSRQIELKREMYLNLYVPLLKWLHSSSAVTTNYYWLIAVPRFLSEQPDKLEQLMLTNFEKLPIQVTNYYKLYVQSTKQARAFYNSSETMYNPKYEAFAKQASELFDLIMIELLKEGSSLAQELGWPNIPKSTLIAFRNEIKHNRTRYIAPQRHKQFLKSGTTEPVNSI